MPAITVSRSAGHVGRTRLIDNLEFDPGGSAG